MEWWSMSINFSMVLRPVPLMPSVDEGLTGASVASMEQLMDMVSSTF